MRRLLVPAATAILLVAGVLGTAGSVRAADVHGDDARDVYVGTGGLILPESVDTDARRRVAGCPGCSWRLTSVCVDPGLGASFDGRGGCSGVVHGCPQDRQLLRAWFRPPGQSWRPVDVVCLGEPVTVDRLGREVVTELEEGLPPLRPTVLPARSAVTQLPVVFASGQRAGPRTWTMTLSGRTVQVTALPDWTWTFGDGSTSTGPRALHVYGRAGSHPVSIVARWSATYVVDGLGPFDVPELVVQSDRVDVAVGEGRAVLVPR